MSSDGDDELERRLRDVLNSRGLGVPVSPDAIDRIHAGARRRQQRRSAASALGTVAITAIAAVAIAARPHGHGLSNVAAGHTASPSHGIASTSSPAPASPTAPIESPTTGTPSTVASAAVVEPTGSAVASIPPVQVFNPVSVSAISVNDYWVIGFITADSGPNGISIKKTTDGGLHFTTIGNPPAFVAQMNAKVPPGTPTVSDIRFGDANNGWAYGGNLFATSDGGMSWSAVTGVPGSVVDLAAASGNVWAVADNEASGSPSYSLFHATYSAGGTSAWAKVSLNTTSFVNVVVIKKSAYLLASTAPTQPGIFVTITNGGATVTSTSGPCAPQTGGVLSVAGDGSLWALCSSGHTTTEFVSTDGGAHWAAAQFPSVTYSIGGVDSTHAVVFDDRELDMITLTTSLPVPSAPGSVAAPGVDFIGFTTTKVGFLIASRQNSTPAQLWRTTDSGQTWTVVTF
jgi:photosystem II stability/assembly factor-like uncharacterized protein